MLERPVLVSAVGEIGPQPPAAACLFCGFHEGLVDSLALPGFYGAHRFFRRPISADYTRIACICQFAELLALLVFNRHSEERNGPTLRMDVPCWHDSLSAQSSGRKNRRTSVGGRHGPCCRQGRRQFDRKRDYQAKRRRDEAQEG